MTAPSHPRRPDRRPPQRPAAGRMRRGATLLGSAVPAAVLAAVVAAVAIAPSARPRRAGERGQGTVEYALLLLGAAAVALAVVSWVTGTNVIGRLFDTVLGRILSRS